MWDPIIEGCTTSTACNYNPEAKEDDNSCIDPLGCDNWCPSDTTEVKELDCADVCGGLKFIDCTGECGILVIDECGVCGGNNTICTDCNGVVNGEAEFDKCGDCVGGDTGFEACTYDCLGYWGGDAETDVCGVCDGIDNYVSGTCNDCAGIPNGTAYVDGCSNCVGGNTGLEECGYDCAGTLGGTSFYDNCGECVLSGDPSCVQSCTGSWVNDGTQLILDECNICGGDNTVCAGCDGIPNSGLEIDVCGVCGGDGTCLPENCTDDNESGYCQDLSVLQILIDNNSETLNMDMDDNGDGVIEPLELGDQEWLDGRLINLYCAVIGLSGEIPPEIGGLTNLKHLVFNTNQLTGEIPPEIGNLTSLITLGLMHNDLTGEIPSEIGNLTSLITLKLYYNEFSGEIPSEIGNLTSLTDLYLYHNELSGVPPEIGNLTSLTDLRLYNNELTGEIPSEIGNLLSLTYLDLSYNELTGEIPSEIGNLLSLTSLYLNNNQLTGEIPSEIGNMTSLTYLNLKYNELTGEIPSEIGNLLSLTSLYLNNNQLTGEIPSEIGNMTYLKYFNLSYNQFSGQMAESLCNIKFLTLYNNYLCPSYPSCLTEHTINSQDTAECPVSGGDPFSFNQSSSFAYYFVFSAYNCEGNYLTANEDWIGVYNGDVCVGGAPWSGGPTDIPAMGDDGQDYSAGYLTAGDMPIFRVYDASEDKYHDVLPNENFVFEEYSVSNIIRMDAVLDVCGICGGDNSSCIDIMSSSISDGETVSKSAGLIIKFNPSPPESFFQADTIIKEHPIWEIINSQSILLNNEPQTFWYNPSTYTCAFIQNTTVPSPDGTGAGFILSYNNNFQVDNVFNLVFYVDSLSALEEEGIKIVPNPYLNVNGDDYYDDGDNKVRFTRLPEQCNITIFSIDGDIINTITHNSLFDGNEWWDLSNIQGEQINFGIYQFQVQSSNFAYDNGVFVYNILIN